MATTVLPNPFDLGFVDEVMPSTEKAVASVPQRDAAAAHFDGADIPMSVLMSRGFDPEAFIADCEPPPLFLRAAEIMPVLKVLARH